MSFRTISIGLSYEINSAIQFVDIYVHTVIHIKTINNIASNYGCKCHLLYLCIFSLTIPLNSSVKTKYKYFRIEPFVKAFDLKNIVNNSSIIKLNKRKILL